VTSDSASVFLTRAGAYRSFLPFAGWAQTGVPDVDWRELAEQLDRQRRPADAEARRAVLDRALAAAAFDTGAIEGLYDTDRGVTETIAAAADVLAAAEAERGPAVRRTFAAQLDGYQHLLDAATEAVPVTEVWLRGLHERLTAGQDTYRVLTAVGWQDQPLPHGQYKTQPNNVLQPDGTRHEYAPVADTPAEMSRLVEQLRGDRFAQAHPVLQAAYAHHALTVIHPFADGNGRMARALASLYLLRDAGIPLLVYADQKANYLTALRAADVGRVQPFADFVADRGLDLLALMTEWLRAGGRRSVAEQVAKLDAAMRSHGGLGHTEVETAGRRALLRAQQTMNRQIEDQLKPPWRAVANLRTRHGDVDFGDAEYRPLTDSVMFQLLLANDELGVHVAADVFVGVARTAGSRYTFRIIDTTHRDNPPLRLRLGEVYPELTRSATNRIDAWAEQLVHDLLAELRRDTTAALHQRGFE
jgi:hypothetical protein